MPAVLRLVIRLLVGKVEHADDLALEHDGSADVSADRDMPLGGVGKLIVAEDSFFPACGAPRAVPPRFPKVDTLLVGHFALIPHAGSHSRNRERAVFVDVPDYAEAALEHA